jgi:hypothetical protein
MRKEVTSRRNNRVYDFPERQVGFPERNDVSNPDIEMERIHVDLETMRMSRKSSRDLEGDERCERLPQMNDFKLR